jgi:hypothetical protein
MPDRASKLKLSDNHRRVVSVLLRGIEQMCDSISAWLDRKPGVLARLEDDLEAAQRERLRVVVEEVRVELRRIAADIELQRASESPRRAIRALVSAMSVELEERQSPRLAGYGPLSDAAKEKIDAEIDRLLALLGRMTEVLR